MISPMISRLSSFVLTSNGTFALNITNTQDVSSYVSHKTLWSMREILSSDGIYDDIFERTLKTLAKYFKADLTKQRMDSVHIQSNMRHLGRIGLFVKTIKKFLCNLKRQHRPLFEKLGQHPDQALYEQERGITFCHGQAL